MYMYLHVYVLMVVKISVQHLVFSPGIYLHVCGLWCVLKFWLYLYLHIYMYSLVYSAYKIDAVLQNFCKCTSGVRKHWANYILTYFYHSCPTPIVQFQVTRHSRKIVWVRCMFGSIPSIHHLLKLESKYLRFYAAYSHIVQYKV